MLVQPWNCRSKLQLIEFNPEQKGEATWNCLTTDTRDMFGTDPRNMFDDNHGLTRFETVVEIQSASQVNSKFKSN